MVDPEEGLFSLARIPAIAILEDLFPGSATEHKVSWFVYEGIFTRKVLGIKTWQNNKLEQHF